MKLTKKIFIVIIGMMLGAAVAINLADNEEVMTGSGEDVSAAEMISLMIPDWSGDTAEVTADGQLSDFLVPGTAGEDYNRGDYILEGTPTVLIYHTHTTEAYRQAAGAEYEESGSWRTADEKNNVIAVGEVLKESLEDYGFTVIHDKTNHEPPKLTTAYDRSSVTMQKYYEEYPEIDVFIDLHRDARNAEVKDDYVTVDGKECAKMMFVVGKGENFSEKPNFAYNYGFAARMNEELKGVNEGLVRNICVKSGRYNQHIGDICCLIEIGHNMNTLEQAKNSAKLFAEAFFNTVKVDNS